MSPWSYGGLKEENMISALLGHTRFTGKFQEGIMVVGDRKNLKEKAENSHRNLKYSSAGEFSLTMFEIPGSIFNNELF